MTSPIRERMDSVKTKVWCRYAPPPASAETFLAPVAGSGVLESVEVADGSTPDQGDLKFAGYLVRLDVDR